MGFLRRWSRLIVWAVFLASLALMIADLSLGYMCLEVVIFYLITNGILIYRVLGVNCFSHFLHVFAFVTAMFLASLWTILYLEDINEFYAIMIAVPFVIQFLLGIHLVCIRPGNSWEQKAFKVCTHAFLGIVVVVLIFWTVGYTVKENFIQCLLLMFYLLLFLFIILTPAFQTRTHTVMRAKKEAKKLRKDAEKGE